MRWKDLRKSRNVEDRRAQGGRGGGIALGGGLGTMILLLVLSFIFKTDLTQLVSGGGGLQQQTPNVPTERSNEYHEFTQFIKGSTEDIWTEIFSTQLQRRYEPAQLISYSGSTPMKVGGVANAAMGPFYVPSEKTAYIDTSFFDQMSGQLKAGGDFAYAYVIAHEIGHHVQNLLGLTDQVHQQKGRVSEREYNRSSVRLELMADCLAGIWARHANEKNIKEKGRPLMQDGDIEEAMRAAKAIGDDTLQKKSQGRVVPDSFTHGTSEQRFRWFMRGWESGNIKDSFEAFNVPYERL
nr:uncharacterized protein YpfJ-like [Nerophis lumbriciformis]